MRLAIAYLALQTIPSANAEVVLVFGDSLSAAYGIPLEEGWVSLLQKRLAGRHRVVNASVSGDTTAGGVRRLDRALKNHRPDVLILELGANDGLRGLSLVHMGRNLKLMIQRARAAGAAVVLVGNRIPPNLGSVYATRYHRLHHELAATYDVPLVPFMLDGVATKPEFMQNDGIHPNQAAQPIILENIWQVLARTLDEP